ncbi:MAG: hypothetical protein J5809_07145 [Selenomonadaceae bacterium]|nr:hypothetical protein [Selenomonadaceae bacterium]
MLERIKTVLLRNRQKKIVALILSTALWFFVMSSQDPVINGSYDVPISMVNVPPKYKALYADQNIRVRLRAPRSYFIDYSENNVRAFANLRDFTGEGEYDIPVETSYPKGFELESVSPAMVRVKLDPFVERQIPAEIIITGSPVEGSIVKNLDRSSDNLTLIGAKTAVNSVRRVIGYIGLNDNAETFDIPVPLSAVDENGREVSDVRVVPSAITVTVVIESNIQKKVVPVVVEVAAPAGREIEKITVNPQNVEITGATEIVNQIEAIKTETLTLPVNVKSFIGKLKFVVPDGVTLSEYEVDANISLKE